jgi:hypothetical protein
MREFLIVFPDDARLKYHVDNLEIQFSTFTLLDLITFHIMRHRHEYKKAAIFEAVEIDGKPGYIKIAYIEQ